MSQASASRSLFDLLTAELAAVHALQSVLSDERDALIHRREDSIVTLAEAKTRRLEALTHLTEERTRFFAAVGIDPVNPATFTRFAARGSASDARCPALWKSLAAAWRKAHIVNHSNGEIAKLHLGRAARAQYVIRQLRGDGVGYRADGALSGHYLSA
jgi:flagellar biosynthesis/type III secretory pathway chaperone